MPSALEMSRSIAVSASLTRTPPKPRKEPSTAASATFWLISRSQDLKAAASSGALASTMAETSRRLVNERCTHSVGCAWAKRSRIARMLPSVDLSKAATAALMSSLELGSRLAAASAGVPAAASLRVPHQPLGSTAETAMPAAMMLSNTLVHSSGVKSFLLAMAVSNEGVLARYFCCLITSKFAPEDVIACCQDEWRAAALERAVRAISAFTPSWARISKSAFGYRFMNTRPSYACESTPPFLGDGRALEAAFEFYDSHAGVCRSSVSTISVDPVPEPSTLVAFAWVMQLRC